MAITIHTDHDTPLFDPDDHRKLAAEQLKADPQAIQCIATGPDGIDEVQPATDEKPRVLSYHRRTTWELKPTVTREPEPERQVIPPLVHTVPKLARGARWHGIIGEVEGNYISTGTDMVLVDSAEGVALLAALNHPA